jgi:DnaK suppressor protein
MDRPDWMNRKWLDEQKAKLEVERDRLRDSIETESSLLGVMGTTSPREPGDIAQEDREDVEVAGSMDVAQSSFQAVEAALGRMEAGTYGRCLDCRGWIPRERLEAMPSALRCVPCQEAFEKRRSQAPITA